MKVLVLGNGPWGAILQNEIRALGHDVRVSNSRMPAVDPSHVDAVVFATPPDVQEKLAPQWITAGVPCFLEKPLALTVEGAYAIWEASTSVGGHGVVCCDHLRTMAPSWRVARVDHRKLKAVGAVVAGPGPDRTWPVKHPFLWDYGPHALAYVLDVIDGEVAALNTSWGPHDVITHFEIDGVECGIRVSNRAPVKMATVYVEFDDDEHRAYEYDGQKERPLTATLQAFFDAIEGKSPVPETLSLARAVKIVKILEEIEEDIERRSA